MDDRRVRTIVAAFVAVTAVWWIIYQLAQPLGDDQGIFVWAGTVIHNGGVMYRDAWDVKGPLVYYLAAASEALFGHHVWAFRALDVMWQMAAIPLLFGTARRAGAGVAAAASAACLYLIWFTALESGNGAQPDAWAGILLCGVAFLMLSKEHKQSSFAYSGFLVGVCCLIKPTYGMFLLMPAIYFVAEPTWRRRFTGLAVTTAAYLVPLFLSIAFFASYGALRDYYDTYIGFTLSVYSVKDAVSWPARAWIAFRILVLSFRFFVPVLIGIVGARTLFRRAPRDASMICVWLVLAVINVMIQGKMIWLYHYLPVYFPMAILASVGIEALITRASSYVGRSRVPRFATLSLAVASVFVMGMVAGGAVLKITAWTRHELGGSPIDGYSEVEFREWGEEPGAIADAAQYVAARTTSNDLVFFTNNWPGGNFLSNRRAPSRLANPRAYMDFPTSRYGSAYGAEFMTALRKTPPLYVVSAGPALCGAWDFQGEYCINHVPAADAWLKSNYAIEKHMRWVDVWRRKGT